MAGTAPKWELPEELRHVNLSVPEPEHLPDKIGPEPSSKDLDGCTFQYYYPSGIAYRVSIADGTAYFSMPEPVHGLNYFSWPCRVRKLRKNQYLVHWVALGRTCHVSLVFDLEEKHVDCAALMPGKFEIWDRATFTNWKTGGDGALYKQPPTAALRPW